MALLIRGNEFWGEFSFKGERLRMGLGVPVCGQPPPNLKLPGDPAFERSRARALAAFETTKAEYSDPKRAADRLERIHTLVTGHTIKSIKPADLFTVWKNARRKKSKLSDGHAENVQATLTNFLNFLGQAHPKLDDSRAVTGSIASEFMATEEQRGLSNKTYDNALITMRAVFNAAGVAGDFTHNPFRGIPKKDDQGVHRRPYDQETLKLILAGAGENEIVGPIVITAICTGMRREDCVRLKWNVVNLKAGEILMNAGKTDSPLFLPILAPLREVLEKIPQKTEHCFPEAVALFDKNPDKLNDGLKKILRSAGLREHEIEVKGPRLRRPSVEGFHRFKTSFVSMALDSGVPMPMLQKLVGNEVVDLVMATYYQPGKDAVKDTISAKFPTFLTGAPKDDPCSVLEQVLHQLDGLAPENWAERCAGAASLVRKAIEMLKPRHEFTHAHDPRTILGGTFGGRAANDR